ncbi:unnamed protein product [Cercopithifilaria johnstoni]|uniref:Uncharacterized protein n=1 Tax=Cercopithifilaria johnstoni TaxID=2874296 RepID=A0A8J2MFD2_9BILA|nr:unnamed protein product [Cercopithifilaria johnstoni]
MECAEPLHYNFDAISCQENRQHIRERNNSSTTTALCSFSSPITLIRNDDNDDDDDDDDNELKTDSSSSNYLQRKITNGMDAATSLFSSIGTIGSW